MQKKAAYIRLKVIGAFFKSCISGSYMHGADFFIQEILTFTKYMFSIVHPALYGLTTTTLNVIIAIFL
jgi:hypothetical protein